MSYRRLPFLWALAAAVAVAPAASGEGGSDARTDCGAYCLGQVLGIMHRSSPGFEALRREVVDPVDGTSTLRGLRDALVRRRVDVRVVPASTGLAEGVYVGHVASPSQREPVGHLVVVHVGAQDRVVLYSPPFEVRETSWSALRLSLSPLLLRCDPAPMIGAPAVAATLTLLAGLLLAFRSTRGRTLQPTGQASRLAALLVAFHLSACAKPAEDEPAVGVSVQPSSNVDLGVRPAGPVEARFSLTNVSDSPIVVERLVSSCSCARVDFDASHPLLPGQSRGGKAMIRVSEGGRQVTTISFVLRDRRPLDLRFSVWGGAADGVELERDQDLGTLVVGACARRDLRLEIDEESAFGRSVAAHEAAWQVFGDACVAVEGTRVEFDGRRRAHIATVATRPRHPHDLGAQVACRIGEHRFEFALRWRLSEPIRVRPEVLSLRRAGAEGALRGTLRVVGTEPGVRLGNIGSSTPGLRVRVVELDEKRATAIVEVVADAGWAERGTGEVVVEILTGLGDPAQRSVLVVFDPATGG